MGRRPSASVPAVGRRADDARSGAPSCSPETTSYTSGSTNYTVVKFNDVGTCNWMVPTGVTSVDVLAVGGGGGGGAWVGGGGGGGGVNFSPNMTVTPSGSISVTVGTGGAGAAWGAESGALTAGENGASSSFGSPSPVTALGGGVGASWEVQQAGTGSSVASGGGGSQNSGTYAGGTGDTGSGGSAATDQQPHAAGGGGGAGGDGENGTGDASAGTGGAGGPGGVSDITGTSIYYGGGGGGGVHGKWSEPPKLEKDESVPISAGDGGVGGGGRGGLPGLDAAHILAGEDGLGGGGGGDGDHVARDSAGGAGGSGVVIVRYTLAMATCSPETTSYTSDSTIYTVVAFKSVGTCSWAIPSGVTMFDWLVVGGGGGGGSWHGAGGGAGGMRFNEGLNVPLDTSFTIQVGAGGDGAPELASGSPTAVRGSSGGASRIIGSSSGLLASVLGGGGGGSGTNRSAQPGHSGADGGSGAGSQADLYDNSQGDGSILPGSGTHGEGYNGGAGAGGGVSHGGATAWVGGGGGGAGGNGGGAREVLGNVTAGDGGNGNTISWISPSAASALGVGEVDGSDVYFAGGGAGGGDETVTYTLGTGGLGGGGDGRLYAVGAGEDGAASTGGGGAGSSVTAGGATRVGGGGGSGVVVLRYAQLTLTYDPRGGSGGPGDTTGSPNSTVTVSSTVPTRSGYAFAGWNTSADGSGSAYTAGDGFTLPSSGTATLYARWQVNTVTLAYDVGEGSGGPAAVSGDAGSVVAVSGTVPVWSGYSFVGWNTQADGSGAAYAAGDGFTLPASGVATLHAQWQNVLTVTPPPPRSDEPADATEPSSSPAPPEASAPPALPEPSETTEPPPSPAPPEASAPPAPPEPSELPIERLVSSDDPAPGEMLTVTVEGFEPDEHVNIYVVAHEEMRPVASTVADAEGVVMAEFVVPSDACGELALIVWAPGSGVGFRQELNVTTCGLGESSDVVQVEIAGDEDDVVGDDDGRTRWWVLLLGVAALVVASARRAAKSKNRSGVTGTT